jgi:hypothetical protein
VSPIPRKSHHLFVYHLSPGQCLTPLSVSFCSDLRRRFSCLYYWGINGILIGLTLYRPAYSAQALKGSILDNPNWIRFWTVFILVSFPTTSHTLPYSAPHNKTTKPRHSCLSLHGFIRLITPSDQRVHQLFDPPAPPYAPYTARSAAQVPHRSWLRPDRVRKLLLGDPAGHRYGGHVGLRSWE